MKSIDSSSLQIESSKLNCFKELFGDDLRIYGSEDDPLFVGVDVCKSIGENESTIWNFVRGAIAQEGLDFIKGTLRNLQGTSGGNPEVTMLTEQGLYTFLASRKKTCEKATQFRKFIYNLIHDLRLGKTTLIKHMEHSLVLKDNKILVLENKIDEILHNTQKVIQQNDELKSKNDHLIQQNEHLIQQNEEIKDDVDIVSTKLDIATDQRVIPLKDKRDEVFMVFRTGEDQYYACRIQKLRRNYSINKYGDPIVEIENSNTVNLLLHIKEDKSLEGKIKCYRNTIRVLVNYLDLAAEIRRVDSEKKNV